MNALNFPAAILQPPYFDPKRPAVDELRRDRRDHRPRDQPQLRRPGRAVRCHRPARNWWTPEDFAHFKASRRRSPQQYDALPAVPRSRGQRQADAGREHRRRRGSRGGVRRLPALARRQAGAGRRRAYGRPAVLHRASRRAGGTRCASAALRQQVITDGHAPASIAPTPFAISTPGMRRSTSSRARRCTSRRKSACGSGEESQRCVLAGSAGAGSESCTFRRTLKQLIAKD